MEATHSRSMPFSVSFIVYNTIFSVPERTFTIPQLMEDLRETYQVELGRDYLQEKVNEYIGRGLVFRKSSCYACVG